VGGGGGGDKEDKVVYRVWSDSVFGTWEVYMKITF
jgi:hypothetical protein